MKCNAMPYNATKNKCTYVTYVKYNKNETK